MDVILVPCTQEKIWDAEPHRGPTPAKDAYMGRAFKTWRAYAESSGCPWFILSTGYGLIEPDQPITAYNVPIGRAVKDRVLLAKLAVQGKALKLDRFDRVVLLDWEKFQPLVKAAVGDLKVPTVRHPLDYP